MNLPYRHLLILFGHLHIDQMVSSRQRSSSANLHWITRSLGRTKDWTSEAERKKMPSLRKILALALSAAPLASTNVLGFGTTERIELPVQQLTLPDGMIRYSVPVSIGGNAPIEAMLDTGSFALRCSIGRSHRNEYTPTQIQRIYRFGSGVRLHGIIAG